MRESRVGGLSRMLVALTLLTVIAAQGPDIVYKYTDDYELIWKDAGSRAKMDGAVWRARNYQTEFCSLGDVATGGWSVPFDKAVLVSDKKGGALAHPRSFTQVWNDRGSGARSDVAIYRMNAPSGYTCLGGVAVGSYSTQPDKSKYCCVKNAYVVRADTLFTWNDKGSGCKSDLSLWTVIRAGGDAYGIDAGTFAMVSGYTQPRTAYLLRADDRKVRDVWSLERTDTKPLNLYEIQELKQIWNDVGSGAYADCSIWRAEARDGYYPVGDVVVASHRKPTIGFLLKPRNSSDSADAVQAPISYSRIWNDKGSGAHKDVQLWRVNCPGGYVALGGVATDGSYPKLGDVYCVKSSYTSYGTYRNWDLVWRDRGSGARVDVSIFEADATSSSQQSVRGFGAMTSWRGYPSSPYLLKKDSHAYWAEKPIEKIFMYNVKYNLKAEKQQTVPVKMSPTTIPNGSSERQKSEREISFTRAESSSFTFSQAIQLGISMAITAGSPIIGAGMTTTVSASTTSTFSTGTTTTNTHTDTVRAEINVPPCSSITAVIIGTQYKSDIPFTATIKKVYYDGTQAFGTISGVYKGVTVNDVKVSYGGTKKIECDED